MFIHSSTAWGSLNFCQCCTKSVWIPVSDGSLGCRNTGCWEIVQQGLQEQLWVRHIMVWLQLYQRENESNLFFQWLFKVTALSSDKISLYHFASKTNQSIFTLKTVVVKNLNLIFEFETKKNMKHLSYTFFISGLTGVKRWGARCSSQTLVWKPRVQMWWYLKAFVKG